MSPVHTDSRNSSCKEANMTTNVSTSLYTNCLCGENVVVVTTQRQVSYTITGRSNTVQRWFYMYATTRGPIVVSTYTYILSFSCFVDSINTLGTIMRSCTFWIVIVRAHLLTFLSCFSLALLSSIINFQSITPQPHCIFNFPQVVITFPSLKYS